MAVNTEELLIQVKTALRTSLNRDSFDENELIPMIEACLCDMQGAGVDINNSKNEFLVRQAVVFYCKANFGLDADNRWQRQYNQTRNALASRTAEVEE